MTPGKPRKSPNASGVSSTSLFPDYSDIDKFVKIGKKTIPANLAKTMAGAFASAGRANQHS